MLLKFIGEIPSELSSFLEKKSDSSPAAGKLLILLRRIYNYVKSPTLLFSTIVATLVNIKNKLKSLLPYSITLVNYLFYYYYKYINWLKSNGSIRSVLQVGIISHKPYMISRVLRKHGIKSEYFALNVDIGQINIGYDYNLPYHISPLRRKFLEIYYLWKVFAKYDAIHYHFSSFLTTDGYELKFLKRLGKLIVFHYRGCDLRQKSINLRKNPDLNCCQEGDYVEGSCETDYHHWKLDTAKKFGDLFFVTTPDLLDFMPEAEHMPFIMPTEIDFDAIRPTEKGNSLFRVVTSSNHHGIDGTGYVRRAITRLCDEGYPLELVEVHGVSFEEALAMYKSADLFVGKLLMGFYNNAVIECMLMGVPCMCYIRDEFLEKVPDCPIIITRPEAVYKNIKGYIDKREELKAIGAKGPEFVRKHHDPDMIVRLMIDRYNQIYQKT
jgi:hypothetical protein